jgi:hypothetical protein
MLKILPTSACEKNLRLLVSNIAKLLFTKGFSVYIDLEYRDNHMESTLVFS